MSVAVSEQQKRIHPHKFVMWLGMGSIVMMFAGLTSAYVVRKNQANWLEFDLPSVFWYSTVVILISSATMQIAAKSFKARLMQRYRTFITITAVLGLAFAALQYEGFIQLYAGGVQLFGVGSNPSASFLGIITGLHALHVVGGVVALIIIVIKAYASKVKSYNNTTVDIISTYWHFVDILWIYLFLFLKLI